MKMLSKWHFRFSVVTVTHVFQVSGMPFTGYLGVYGGGGFIATLDVSQAVSRRVLDELQEYLWLDRKTTAIILEFTVYSPNIDLLGFVMMLAERGQTGGLIHKGNVQVLRAYGMGASTIFFYICCVTFMIFYFGHIVVEIKNLKQLKCRAYFRRAKTYLHLSVIVIGSGMFGLFVVRMVEVDRAMSLVRQDITQYVQFRRAATVDELLKNFVAFMNLIVILKLVILLRLHERMSDLLSTLKQSAAPLASFLMIFITLLVAYTGFCTTVYGLHIYTFRSFFATLKEVIVIAMGSFDLESMMAVNKGMTQLFFTSYMVSHDDAITWKHFQRYWPFVRGIQRSPVNSPHKGQWRRALIFSLICFWINGKQTYLNISRSPIESQWGTLKYPG